MDQAAPTADTKISAAPETLTLNQDRPGYAVYALLVLFVVCVLCYIDRTIITAVGESLRAEMNLTDAELGFLFGTSFSILFAVVGFPLGRLSDVLPRTKLMSIGLMFWSLMTMFSGLASNFAMLAATRIGLGLGEATANPCSHSLISQYFSRASRGRAMSVYLLGTSVGGGLALFVGGWMVQHWAAACSSVPIPGACGLTGWRAAMMLVGGPGILVSLLVWTLREPPRPLPPKQNIGAIVLREFSASVPPLTFWAIGREGGSKALGVNIALATAIILTAIGLGWWTHDWPQWIGLGLGVYALLSWGSMLRIRDLPLYKLTYGCPTFMTTLGGYTFLSCIMISIQFWSVPYAIRVLEIPPAKAGLYMGVATAGTAVLGNLIGGILLDWWRKRDVRAPLWIGMISMILKAPFVFVMFTTKDPDLFMVLFLLQAIVGSMYPPGAAVVAQELVLVRMRGTAAACFSLTILLVSLAFGPYMLGKISTITGSLSLGILSAYVFAPFSIILFLLAARRLPTENEASRLARARQYGEPV